ncbi:HTTM domain-containing protein [Streptomyces beihaiensis]|uniref:HTTM domain-containing protein n=1 Tax=Streptomyces beihaiensis TaxID=2984495 RepID=A0ABT3TZB0_9ACTN|nr:HTTM domain-containing protein [Streptomyces beihaiensis]MCX3061801.1 HTTM domain-containing protein [Streptomyces beihaiensis]
MSGVEVRARAGLQKITASALGPYQSAVIRIGFSATWLLFLLREFPHRQELYGPDAPWSWDLARQLIADNHAFTTLMWSDGQAWFETVYAAAVLVSALLMLGWRTRAMAVLFMVGVLSLQNRSVFVGDGGDNVLHLMSIYLVFTRCGQVWSLDARRAARARAAGRTDEETVADDRVGPVLWSVLGAALVFLTVTGQSDFTWRFLLDPPVVPLVLWSVWLGCGLWWYAQRRGSRDLRLLCDVVTNTAHNAALSVIMVEACLVYATAGWYKIQGTRWQDGTAVYYPLHLDYFSPWPALGDLMTRFGLMVLIVTYVTVAVQVAFPFTVFNRRLKNVLLVFMMTEHAVIAVTLGLPFFSLAMITTDAVFLPTSFLRRVGGWVGRACGRPFSRAGSENGVELPARRPEPDPAGPPVAQPPPARP